MTNATVHAGKRGTRLNSNDRAPVFQLPQFSANPRDGAQFDLAAQQGRYTLLVFFRFAGCPFCNLHIHRLSQSAEALTYAGIDVVGVFGSSLEHIQQYAGQQFPPFPLLADEDDQVHDLYRTERSIKGMFNLQNLAAAREGMKLGTIGGSSDGEAFSLPADFLIGPNLQIRHAHYGQFFADHLNPEEVIRLVQNSH
jgi:thioredoxin-dependent peroxiredoxin